MKYFIRFDTSADINYIYLFSFYSIASYNKATARYDTILYSSISQLSKSLNISTATLNRVLNNTEYSNYFSIDKQSKIIRLKNNFQKGVNIPFVCLSSAEVSYLLSMKDNLLCKYYIYIKYYCGYNSNKQDFTAKQFLTAYGYSTSNNDYITKVSSYNGLLLERGFIDIERYTDQHGHSRNIYRLK